MMDIKTFMMVGMLSVVPSNTAFSMPGPEEDERSAQIEAVFKACDTDNSGFIERSELAGALGDWFAKRTMPQSPEALEVALEVFDAGKETGKLTREEFRFVADMLLTVGLNPVLLKKRLERRAVFQACDVNADGTISKEELAKACNALLGKTGGFPLDISNLTERFPDFDWDKESITKAEFDVMADMLLDVGLYPLAIKREWKTYELFQMYDTNNDGTISAQEFKSLMQDLFSDTTMELTAEDDDDEFFKSLDADKNGYLTLDECRSELRLLMRVKSHRIELRKLFQEYDKDNSGELSREEVTQAYVDYMKATYMPELPKGHMDRILDDFDTSGDNVWSLEEFVTLGTDILDTQGTAGAAS